MKIYFQLSLHLNMRFLSGSLEAVTSQGVEDHIAYSCLFLEEARCYLLLWCLYWDFYSNAGIPLTGWTIGLALQATCSFLLLAYVHFLYREISPSTCQASVSIQKTGREKTEENIKFAKRGRHIFFVKNPLSAVWKEKLLGKGEMKGWVSCCGHKKGWEQQLFSKKKTGPKSLFQKEEVLEWCEKRDY